MIAVRVTADVESHKGEVVIEAGAEAQVADGHLCVYDADSEAVAAFAPGHWLAFKKDERFSG